MVMSVWYCQHLQELLGFRIFEETRPTDVGFGEVCGVGVPAVPSVQRLVSGVWLRPHTSSLRRLLLAADSAQDRSCGPGCV